MIESTTHSDAPSAASLDFTSLSGVIGAVADVERLRSASPSSFDAASKFWRVPMNSPHLTARMKELILVGMHASVTTLNVDAVERHIRRAQAAGASDSDIVDVLVTIVAVANHALYFSMPILQEELEAAGAVGVEDDPYDPQLEKIKQDFMESRGFWNTDREPLARLIPDYYHALNDISTESWRNGSLTPKERSLVCIGIDCTVTHSYEPGLRRHIRNALKYGATRDEILDVFQLSGMIGLETYIAGARFLGLED
ncbi:carboxymuconolactone decarboxylase family protein [Rhodococcus rhodochrous]|uniref:Carboxymuconolactone decarboxylase family protein n=1 Tax=Rhodococcus rhodochrous TaxID=1829 RepID=A0AAW4XP96_RHORH|nr:carboxymuconolactone decarboxylase family protein [Rhodococcus rhodochrous]MCD2114883.1 carboxymuconolactone decarboxylase family protein [Rhodococcus rhodochrous]